MTQTATTQCLLETGELVSVFNHSTEQAEEGGAQGQPGLQNRALPYTNNTKQNRGELNMRMLFSPEKGRIFYIRNLMVAWATRDSQKKNVFLRDLKGAVWCLVLTTDLTQSKITWEEGHREMSRSACSVGIFVGDYLDYYY